MENLQGEKAEDPKVLAETKICTNMINTYHNNTLFRIATLEKSVSRRVNINSSFVLLVDKGNGNGSYFTVF